ncbi:MAG: hypothetical protein JWN04_5123, partial [Myxococcaceae bacterium]|nr:hypothetical protein [Myxococcaceae bacterium]
LTSPRELRRSPMNDLSEGLGGLAPTQGYASSLRSESNVPEQTESSWSAFVLLTRSDRTVLSLLYVSAQAEGADLQRVDDVARALLALRRREQALRTPEAERNTSFIRLAAPRLPGELGASAPHAASEPSSNAEREAEPGSQAPWSASSESFTSLSFGNAAGFAARALSSYRSLLPPATSSPSLPPPAAGEGAVALGAPPADPSVSSATLARSFSAAQALGVSSLIDSLTRNLQTTRRGPRKASPRARDGRASTPEQDADREARRRARWHALFSLRRAQRRAAGR